MRSGVEKREERNHEHYNFVHTFSKFENMGNIPKI